LGESPLNEDVCLFFEKKPLNSFFGETTEYDKGDGRIEMRCCKVTEDIEWLKGRHPQWQKLTSIIEIESRRMIKEVISTENYRTSD
jgi:hypothetical protein